MEFVHPVVCRKFCTIALKCIAVCIVITIICPFYSLHCTTETAIVACKVYTEEFTVATASRLHFSRNAICCFQRFSLKAGSCSVCSCAECKGISVLCCCLKSVGICIDFCCFFISTKAIFSITTKQFFAVFYYFKCLLECIIICCFYFYRNIFQAGYFILSDIYTVYFSFAAGNSASVCKNHCCFVFPSGKCIGLSVRIVNSCHCLETSSVETMVCSCSCDSIKTAKVTLISSVFFIRRGGVCCFINTLCFPVLFPCKSCVYVFVFTGILCNSSCDCVESG